MRKNLNGKAWLLTDSAELYLVWWIHTKFKHLVENLAVKSWLKSWCRMFGEKAILDIKCIEIYEEALAIAFSTKLMKDKNRT